MRPSRAGSDRYDPVRMRIAILANGDSGSGGTASDVAQAAQEAIAQNGASVEVRIASARDVAGEAERIISTGPDRLLVAGGDGTIATAVRGLKGTDIALGVIPLGTMNLVARDLGIPLDPMEAVHAMVDAEEDRIDVAEVNGVLFLHSSLIGMAPRIAKEREGMRRAGTVLERARRLAAAVREASAERSIRIRVEAGGRAVGRRTLGLVVSNNRLSDNPLTPHRRESMRDGLLTAYLSRHEGAMGRVRYLFTMGAGWWYTDDAVEVLEAPEIRVSVAAGEIDVVSDGELARLRSPLVYRMHRGALRVLRPRPRSDEAEA